MKTSFHSDCLDCKTDCIKLFLGEESLAENEWKGNKAVHSYNKGELIFNEGALSVGLYCVGQGIVKISTLLDDGTEIILRLLGPGAIIGHSCNSIFKYHIYSAVAVEETKCCFYELETIQELQKDNPLLTSRILHRVEKELIEAHSRNAYLMKKSVRERLAIYFTSMAELYGEPCVEGIKLKIRLSRQEIASYVGTALETAIRSISEFKSQGLIKEENKMFIILNPSKVQELSGLPV